jgi:predicted phosphohydrolase
MKEYTVDKIRLASDIHLNYLNWSNVALELCNDDFKNDALLLAGDIATCLSISKLKDFFERISSSYKHIFLILGNHDFWYGNIETSVDTFKDALSEFSNIVVMTMNTPCIINDYYLIADTLWTDFNKESMYEMRMWNRCMNDAVYIKREIDERTISVNDLLLEYKNQLSTLFSFVTSHKDKKIIVMTHHAPDAKSVSERYSGEYTNAYYYSDLSDFINENKHIAYWVHGHMHGRFNYLSSATMVVCNAHGYTKEISERYTPIDILSL